MPVKSFEFASPADLAAAADAIREWCRQIDARVTSVTVRRRRRSSMAKTIPDPANMTATPRRLGRAGTDDVRRTFGGSYGSCFRKAVRLLGHLCGSDSVAQHVRNRHELYHRDAVLYDLFTIVDCSAASIPPLRDQPVA